MNGQKTIAELSDGDEIVGFFVIRRCELKETDGLFRAEVELSDKTGSVHGVIWEDARLVREQCTKGSVVKIKGRLGKYRDKPQLRIDKIRLAQDGEFDSEFFLPTTPNQVEILTERLKTLCDSIHDVYMSRLVKLIFSDEQFLKEFIRSPGGKQWHHPYLGGLLEHSVGVAEICDFIAQHHSELNRDLLVLSALLHDVGKMQEYSITTMIDYTDEGRLEGHIIIGERFVRRMTERIEGFPHQLRMLLSHLMLSHQGKKELSSPVEPMIPEGFVLYYADELDSKLNAVNRIVQRNLQEGNIWSDFDRILNRYIYIQRSNETNE